jgi:hypothetical protein
MLRLEADKKIHTDRGKEVTAENLLQYLFTEPIESIDGWTLRDFINLAMTHKELLGEMSWCNVQAFYDEMQQPKPTSPWFEGKILAIELQRVAEITKYEPDYISEYIDVTGRTNDPQDRYAIEFTPVNELADLPIVINEKYEITREIDGPPWHEPVLSSKKPFYLLDVIWALLWEISFVGSPGQRDAKWKELEEARDSITPEADPYSEGAQGAD